MCGIGLYCVNTEFACKPYLYTTYNLYNKPCIFVGKVCNNKQEM